MNLPFHIQDCLKRYPELIICQASLLETFNTLVAVFKDNKKLLICGNGGSAADADHIAGELMKSFLKKSPPLAKWKSLLEPDLFENLQNGLPAISLSHLNSFNTAFANDCNPYYVYAQSTFTLGNPGDALLCISTSGNAKNVLLAAKVAKAKGMRTIGLTGSKGKALASLVDTCISVPQDIVYKIQELHLPIYHALTLDIEEVFFP